MAPTVARSHLRHADWRLRRDVRGTSAATVGSAATGAAIPPASATSLSEALSHVLQAATEASDLDQRLNALADALERDDATSPGIRRSAKLRKPHSGLFFHTPPHKVLRERRPCAPAIEGPRGQPPLEVPRLSCEQRGALPTMAADMLARPAAFVLRDHGLWPAAEERWGQREFLEAELAGVSCAVLSAPSNRKEFCYWMPPRRHSSLEEAMRARGDRVLAPYVFDEPDVSQLNLGVSEFFALADGSDTNGRGQCFYLQHQVVKPVPVAEGEMRATMQPTPGLGSRMRDDIEHGIDRALLERIRQAGDLGPWSVTVLFVGVAQQAAGARTRLHYDMVDNVYLQVAGKKTFRLFEPSQGGDLYPYPWHHPMDRSARVDLNAERSAQLKRFPRFGEARGVDVTLHPGDMLFLPAYWWHEVVTDAPAASHAPDPLVVSVNWWFSALPRLTTATSPLTLPMLHVELAQQLQMIVADALDDRGSLVPTFVKAMHRQLEATMSTAERCQNDAGQRRQTWGLLQKGRPADVEAAHWEALFLFITAKLCFWLRSPRELLSFLRRHCDVSKFERLQLRHVAR